MKIEEIIESIEPVRRDWIEKAQARTAQLAMPPRALGRLHEISERICGMLQTLEPTVSPRAFLVMAGDHGVVADGVSAFPQEVTGEMVKNFLRGGAGINVLARAVNAEVIVVDMGIIPDIESASGAMGEKFRVCKVARGTANIVKGPAMSRQQATEAILSGFRLASELFAAGTGMMGTGDMGIGNTTSSSAIGAVLTGRPVEQMVGRGTGVDDGTLIRKRDIIEQAVDVNRPDPKDGLDVMAKVGGFEIGGIAGTVLAAAYHRRPVVIDGFISTAGALIAHALCPQVVDYIFAGHCSEEAGHCRMLEHLGLEPILDLRMRLGEGTGAALAMGIIEGAVRIFNEVLTFEQAGVSKA
ncbi:MAG: nicotinate-nucleotide--dimethylbenzimidazole phosphoribosyltransferase [Desulforhabdus sp.]|jgi:nicotinate-nucleotide--dimethylbenzimidazole phosphoribosyltransferase|nr:nicotinate-nucleotide--dimethylbenzimidazole phosphoribosyltransferase [Desulforhabdus sp.]